MVPPQWTLLARLGFLIGDSPAEPAVAAAAW